MHDLKSYTTARVPRHRILRPERTIHSPNDSIREASACYLGPSNHTIFYRSARNCRTASSRRNLAANCQVEAQIVWNSTKSSTAFKKSLLGTVFTRLAWEGTRAPDFRAARHNTPPGGQQVYLAQNRQTEISGMERKVGQVQVSSQDARGGRRTIGPGLVPKHQITIPKLALPNHLWEGH